MSGPAAAGAADPAPAGAGTLPLRAELRGRSPYGAPQLDVPVRLNVNENPYPPSPRLVADLAAAVADVAGGLNRYPDRDATALRADLADYLRRDGAALAADRVWAANGSNEVMLQLLQTFGGPGRTVLGFAPTYSMYPDYALDTCTAYVTAPREPDFTLDPGAARAAVLAHRPSLVLLASPNNPTGTALPPATTEQVLAAAGEVGALVVVDEAYAEFRRAGVPSAVTLLDRHRNLVVTRTMSKAFAFAGARVGYLAAAPEIVDAVQLVRLPYHLSAVTQAVARTALRHADDLLAAVDLLRRERDDVVAWLRGRGLQVADTDANFALFAPPRAADGTAGWDRHAVWAALLDRGVLIRETGPAPWLRVSVGTPAEMAAFRAALADVTVEVAADDTGPGVPADEGARR